jgi:UDP-N-acetylmuramoyl-tripeptide--D-alanyl-D-alanine ligase
MPSLDISIPLSLPGIHQASNLGMALAAASFDTDERAFHWPSQERIEEKLAGLQLPGGRWAEFRAGKRLIIDDAYNANPTSVRAALATIEAYDDPVWFVFGTLEEVSEDPHYVAEIHRALGEEAIAIAEKVIGVGEMAKAIAGGAGKRGMEFESNQQIVDYLLTEAPERIVLLLKGSRAARLEEVREALLAEWGEG